MLPDATQFSLPDGIRKVDKFYFKETLLDGDCTQWTEGFSLDGFALLPAAEGYYQKTGAIDMLDGIETYGFGPVWFLNTENTSYGFRVVKHVDNNYYPALFLLGGDDDLSALTELYYLSNPLTTETDDGPAYAPWVSDGAAVWKDSATDAVVTLPELAVGKSFVRIASPLEFVPWVEFLNGSQSLTWSAERPGLSAFVVRGPFTSRHDRIVLNWTGVKQEFADVDVTPFDVRCAKAVSHYVKAMLLAGHKDRRLHAKHYEGLWLEERRSLYLDHKDVGDTM